MAQIFWLTGVKTPSKVARLVMERTDRVFLVDRGARELPVQADFAAARVALPAAQSLALARTEGGKFHFQIKEA